MGTHFHLNKRVATEIRCRVFLEAGSGIILSEAKDSARCAMTEVLRVAQDDTVYACRPRRISSVKGIAFDDA